MSIAFCNFLKIQIALQRRLESIPVKFVIPNYELGLKTIKHACRPALPFWRIVPTALGSQDDDPRVAEGCEYIEILRVRWSALVYTPSMPLLYFNSVLIHAVIACIEMKYPPPFPIKERCRTR